MVEHAQPSRTVEHIEYVVCVFNLGAPPSAATTTQAQPFVVRFCASAGLVVTAEDASLPNNAALAVDAFHCALLNGSVRSVGDRAQALLQGSLLLELRLPAMAVRTTRRFGAVTVVTSTVGSITALLATHEGGGSDASARTAITVEVVAQVKVMLARGGDGELLKPHPSLTADANRDAKGECSFIYRYTLRESCSQFDSLPLTYLPPRTARCESRCGGASCDAAVWAASGEAGRRVPVGSKVESVPERNGA
jgi:hypothetical protein